MTKRFRTIIVIAALALFSLAAAWSLSGAGAGAVMLAKTSEFG